MTNTSENQQVEVKKMESIKVIKTAEQAVRKIKNVPFEQKTFIMLTDFKNGKNEDGSANIITKGSIVKVTKEMFDYLVRFDAIEEVPVYEQ